MEEMAFELNQTRLTKTFPEEIYLQATEWDSDYAEIPEVTHCEDRINEQDVKYIRADLVRRK